MSLGIIIDQLRSELVTIDAQRAKVLAAIAALDDTEPVVPVRLPEGAPIVAPNPPARPKKAAAKSARKQVPCPNGCGHQTTGQGMYQHLKKCSPAPAPAAAVAPPEHGTVHRALVCETCGHQEFRLVDLAKHTDDQHRRPLTVNERVPRIITAKAS